MKASKVLFFLLAFVVISFFLLAIQIQNHIKEYVSFYRPSVSPNLHHCLILFKNKQDCSVQGHIIKEVRSLLVGSPGDSIFLESSQVWSLVKKEARLYFMSEAEREVENQKSHDFEGTGDEGLNRIGNH